MQKVYKNIVHIFFASRRFDNVHIDAIWVVISTILRLSVVRFINSKKNTNDFGTIVLYYSV